MKDIFKFVFRNFLAITVAVLFIMSLANAVAVIDYYNADYPWVVMATGAVTAPTTLLLCFREEPTKKKFFARLVIHFLVIEAIVLGEGFLLKWYESTAKILIVAALIAAVYALVYLSNAILGINTANSINKALKDFNADEDTADD